MVETARGGEVKEAPDIAGLEAELNHFDRQVRARALVELASLAEAGSLRLEPESRVANMHCHSFFSFNAYGHSPSSLAWLAGGRTIA